MIIAKTGYGGYAGFIGWLAVLAFANGLLMILQNIVVQKRVNSYEMLEA
jgi:hypothetical protein